MGIQDYNVCDEKTEIKQLKEIIGRFIFSTKPYLTSQHPLIIDAEKIINDETNEIEEDFKF